MESKLNEILELCVQKSCHENKVFYIFEYDSLYTVLRIRKINLNNHVNEECYFGENEIDKALEYMQNE